MEFDGNDIVPGGQQSRGKGDRQVRIGVFIARSVVICEGARRGRTRRHVQAADFRAIDVDHASVIAQEPEIAGGLRGLCRRQRERAGGTNRS